MKILSGIDLVYLPRFKKSAKSGGENFLRRVFLKMELENQQIEHLAGIFAAKEAITKALSLPPGSWHDIKIIHTKSGAPKVETTNYELQTTNYSLSISHDGNYVIAQFVVLIDE